MRRTTLRRRALGLAAFAAALALPGTVESRQAAQPPLQATVQGLLGGSADEWSVFAWSMDRKRPLFAVNADSVMISPQLLLPPQVSQPRARVPAARRVNSRTVFSEKTRTPR